MSPQTPSSPDPIQHRMRRKPPPTLDISERYPSPDPSDPFAPLWVLRNRTTSGLSSQDVLESRTRSSYIYSTTAAQVSFNTSISPIRTPSQKVKIGHYHPYSLASQPDLLHRGQPLADRHKNVRSPRQTSDMYDSSGTESDTASVRSPSHKAKSMRPRRTASSNYRFPKLLLLRKASFLGSGKTVAGNRSGMTEFEQIQKSSISPPVISTVTWGPDPISRASMYGQSASKLATLSGDLPDYASDKDIHHRHHKWYPATPDGRKDLKQDFPRLRKVSCIPVSPKLSRKKIPSFSPNNQVSTRTRSISFSSNVHTSKPAPVLSCSQHTPADTYTSPPEVQVPLPISVTVQEQAPEECPDKSCGGNCTHSTSSEWVMPSPAQLNYAASLPITDGDGEHITFGSLFESQRTIVIFIRHLWCPLCQEYMSSVKSLVRPEMVSNACESGDDNDDHRSQSQNHGTTEGDGDRVPRTRVRFVMISNGAHGMIAKYRQIFRLPFKVYTDPTLAVYQALGMGRDSDVQHHDHNLQTHRRSTSESSSSDVISEKKSDIIKNGGHVKYSLMGGITMVMRALKVCMPVSEKGGDISQLGEDSLPIGRVSVSEKGDDTSQLGGEISLPLGRVCSPVWEKGGDTSQLGGEFVLGPGLTCTYAHRMQITRGHAPIQDVLQAAGISATNRIISRRAKSRRPQSEPTVSNRPTSITFEKGPQRRRESMEAVRDKENFEKLSRRYSIGMMSREEEDLWMETRANSIERLQERKNIRRGGMNRPTSSHSQSSRQYHQSLETMGEDYREERVIEDSEGDQHLATPVDDVA
ncbi:hypothetical protein BYT27DRAFT_7261037 [Phlegmacium glaucopus]|nr:hypothetical protein BYT27DRAFT_7261037 [Phlegmacium glaucopus]